MQILYVYAAMKKKAGKNLNKRLVLKLMFYLRQYTGIWIVKCKVIKI